MPGRFEYFKSTACDVSASKLAAWHFRPGAIHRLIPPWERIRVLREAAPLVDGARAERGGDLDGGVREMNRSAVKN